MEKQEKSDKEEVAKKKSKDEIQEMPFCTTAPSAEHARGDLDDDPCDDYREGE